MTSVYARNLTVAPAFHRLLLLALLHATSAAVGGTAADDLQHRDPAIHWPKAFDPATAAIFSHNELLIHADCHHVFTRMADATHWPDWFVLVKDVRLQDPSRAIGPGTVLRLSIFGTPITTRIDEFVPDSRLSWYPATLDQSAPTHYHTWHFTPDPSGCRVVTEETGISPDDARLARAGDTTMHRAHDLWLASLRWASEQ